MLRSFHDEKRGRSNQKLVCTLPLEDKFGRLRPSKEDLPLLSDEEFQEVSGKIEAMRKKRLGGLLVGPIQDLLAAMMKLSRMVKISTQHTREHVKFDISHLYDECDLLTMALSEAGLSRAETCGSYGDKLSFETREALKAKDADYAVLMGNLRNKHNQAMYDISEKLRAAQEKIQALEERACGNCPRRDDATGRG
jgi:hypothetical protein